MGQDCYFCVLHNIGFLARINMILLSCQKLMNRSV